MEDKHIDYKELLSKYMAVICFMEGISFVRDCYVGPPNSEYPYEKFSEAEIKALQKIEVAL